MPVAKTPIESDDEEPKQTDAFMDDALGSVRETFIEFERKRIVDRLRRGREKMRAIHGRCEGQKPFGYYEGEASTLLVIYTLRDRGTTCQAIADHLNAHNLMTRTHAQGLSATVAKILRRRKSNVGQHSSLSGPCTSQYQGLAYAENTHIVTQYQTGRTPILNQFHRLVL